MSATITPADPGCQPAPAVCPIVLVGWEVRATLNRSKVQLRWPLNPQPGGDIDNVGDGESIVDMATGRQMVCPFGVPGDWLWVQETWCPVNDEGHQWIDYRATPWDAPAHPAGWHHAPHDLEALKWRASTCMPRWASRLTLRITDVWLDRVQAISEEDAQAEGIPFEGDQPSPRDTYSAQWEARNARRGFPWDSNPWAWVISYDPILENVDTVLRQRAS